MFYARIKKSSCAILSCVLFMQPSFIKAGNGCSASDDKGPFQYQYNPHLTIVAVKRSRVVEGQDLFDTAARQQIDKENNTYANQGVREQAIVFRAELLRLAASRNKGYAHNKAR